MSMSLFETKEKIKQQIVESLKSNNIMLVSYKNFENRIEVIGISNDYVDINNFTKEINELTSLGEFKNFNIKTAIINATINHY